MNDHETGLRDEKKARVLLYAHVLRATYRASRELERDVKEEPYYARGGGPDDWAQLAWA